MTNLGPLVRIRFSTERAGKKIRWTHSSRLKSGTIVALTPARDRFRTTCMPAIVLERAVNGGLDRNPPEIQLQWTQLNKALFDPNEELLMVEARSSLYESVRHCLVGLQHAATTEWPLEKYLIGGSSADLTPAYVNHNSRVDLTPLIGEEHKKDWKLMNKYRNYDVLGGIPDDIGPYTSLDNSQLEAVHRILTKELAIIQGPPGTGKTFTSVQALRILLRSQKRSGPSRNVIVVAAETNHALDQILMQLIKLGHNVVRLGSRSRDEHMRQHTLYNLRRRVSPAMGGSLTKEQHISIDADYRRLEQRRKACARDIVATFKEVFPQELLDPMVLQEHGIITENQLESLLTGENDGLDWVDHTSEPVNRPDGIMETWLGDYRVDVSLRDQPDPIFDVAELVDDENIPDLDPVDDLDLDLDAPIEDGDDRRLRGEWIKISRKWGGANPREYTEADFILKRAISKDDLWAVDPRLRGALYEYWQRELIRSRSQSLRHLIVENVRITKQITMIRTFRDFQAIRRMNIEIIGCTTTGLCKFRPLLAALEPRTILVEEAAMSREATLASALFPGVQQLILVGDHQQLVPIVTTALAIFPYNLAVSMFERLVCHLKVPYTMLNAQRRMIPLIREVLNPFYATLGDHPVVRNREIRPPVPGMAVESYLFTHDWVEGMDSETLSRYNVNEADMVVMFMRYLMCNEVPMEKITVLTFYRGQRKRILTSARKYLLDLCPTNNLSVHTVDSYQGEENDIVILSLVRSSQSSMPGRAGFVQDKNRGVVSISRARRGFYIFGNIENLERATNESQFMWGSVRRVFESQGRYDPKRRGIPLRCENHGRVIYATCPEDLESNHGGCWQRCEGKFDGCGHDCDRYCHP
jgi:helicase required for RNAi-mediated heterochromatin assembly 1